MILSNIYSERLWIENFKILNSNYNPELLITRTELAQLRSQAFAFIKSMRNKRNFNFENFLLQIPQIHVELLWFLEENSLLAGKKYLLTNRSELQDFLKYSALLCISYDGLDFSKNICKYVLCLIKDLDVIQYFVKDFLGFIDLTKTFICFDIINFHLGFPFFEEIIFKALQQPVANKKLELLFTAVLEKYPPNLLLEKLMHLKDFRNVDTFLNIASKREKIQIGGLKKVTDPMIMKALNEGNVLYLSNALKIGRMYGQSCYLKWFGASFSQESTRPLNTSEKAKFFFKYLSETVDEDSSVFLKVHINKVPYVPIGCQNLLHDYVKLVKMRLNNFNESFEFGFFENTSKKRTADNDVDQVLKYFEKKQELPKNVLDLIAFRRVYFERNFLTSLLATFEGTTSVRHQVIMKFKELGKIPASAFSKYLALSDKL